MKKVECKWACGDCGNVHDSLRDAALCCAPYPEQKYICPECDAEHYDYFKAIECCGEEE